MPALILVRHGPPAIDPAVPVTAWGLGTEGRGRIFEAGVGRLMSSQDELAFGGETAPRRSFASARCWNSLGAVGGRRPTA